MKRIINSAIFAVVMLAMFAAPVAAFDVPTQGTDNATDVILWLSDNVTIEWSDNLTIETVTVEVDIDGLTDSNENIAEDYLSFFIVAFLVFIIFKYGNTVLYAFGVPITIVYGFTMAGSQDVYSPLWVSGLFIGLLGLYFLYEIVKDPIRNVIKSIKSKE